MRRLLDLVPPEARVFAEMAVFGLLVGGGYWFLTYETAGSVLLVAFGAASAIALIAIVIGSRRGRRSPDRATLPEARPAAEARVGEPLPRPGWSPLLIGLGLGGLALGAAFGPWLAIAGLLVTLAAARGWLETAMRETDEARGAPARDPLD